MPADHDTLLDSPPALRRLRAGEAPYPGWLHAGAPPTVWVDLESVPAAAWRCRLDGHVLAPLDVARTATGQAAVVPHCPRTLAEVVHARPAPGAAVTIAVSVLRAATEARALDVAEGAWWVDASGRPVLAASNEGGDWAGDASALLDELGASAGPELQRALLGAAAMLRAARWTAAEAQACEERLFDAAQPRPLELDPLRDPGGIAPVRAASLRREVSSRHPSRGETPVETRSARTSLASFADAEWGERLGEAWRSVREAVGDLRERRRERRLDRDAAHRQGGRPDRGDGSAPRRRRTPLLVAAAAGVAVVAGGLAWPHETPRDTSAAAVVSAPSVSAPSVSAPAPDPSASTADGAGAADTPASDQPQSAATLEDAARASLDALPACAADPAVCPGVLEDPGRGAPEGIVSSAIEGRSATLLDEYGGLAVFRVEAPDEPGQILVLVSADGRWLVREAYDLADQP